MVRRKDSLGFVDFLRGKYNQYNDFHLKHIIKEMTKSEIYNILHCSYEELWNKLWNKKNESYDKKNMEKFNYIVEHKKYLFDLGGWDEPEWGFPKGRRNVKESDFNCSIREFEEETGYETKYLTMIKNIGFFEEIFTGSNMKSYRHKYYLCKGDYKFTYNETLYQKSEIGNLKWFTYEECLKKIRCYNYEKIRMITKINNILNK
jgi:8-oxo-dGTP pyrophosphatase MutT (NUDIX family)